MMTITVTFVLGLVVLAITLLLIVGLFQELRFGARAQRFSGRIIDFAAIRSYRTRMYAPVIEWLGPDGKHRKFRSSSWFSWRRYEIGQSVGVLCGPAKGELRVCIDSFHERFGLELFMLFLFFSITLVLAFSFWQM